MNKFFLWLLVTLFSFISWNQAQAATYTPDSQGYEELCERLGISPNRGSAIVEPDWIQSNDPSRAVWLVYDEVLEGGFEVKLLAFAYGWLPTSGLITIRGLGPSPGDRILKDGFEDQFFVGVGGGVMDSSWWFGGPPNYQTDRIFALLESERYFVNVDFRNQEVNMFTTARFTFATP